MNKSLFRVCCTSNPAAAAAIKLKYNAIPNIKYYIPNANPKIISYNTESKSKSNHTIQNTVKTRLKEKRE